MLRWLGHLAGEWRWLLVRGLGASSQGCSMARTLTSPRADSPAGHEGHCRAFYNLVSEFTDFSLLGTQNRPDPRGLDHWVPSWRCTIPCGYPLSKSSNSDLSLEFQLTDAVSPMEKPPGLVSLLPGFR